jgi:UDP-N-acetylglucosamine 2-epimerase
VISEHREYAGSGMEAAQLRGNLLGRHPFSADNTQGDEVAEEADEIGIGPIDAVDHQPEVVEGLIWGSNVEVTDDGDTEGTSVGPGERNVDLLHPQARRLDPETPEAAADHGGQHDTSPRLHPLVSSLVFARRVPCASHRTPQVSMTLPPEQIGDSFLLALCFGTRPQVVKASMLLDVLQRRWQVIAVDTDQHYDFELNGLFYQQLGVPRPDHFLEVGSDTAASQTAAVLTRTAEVLRAQRPAAVVVVGDTNSTLGAALAASKEGYPVVHVEAGLRSSEPDLPEENNRRVVDVLSRLLCAPSAASEARLRAEEAPGIVVNTGDVARDVLLRNLQIAPPPQPGPPFVLATFHRAALTSDSNALAALIDGLAALDMPILLPLHPRTRAALEGFDLLREAYWLNTPCVTVRGDAEWAETVACGASAVVPVSEAPRLLATTVVEQRRKAKESSWTPDAYGDGHAAERIRDAIADLLGRGSG